MTNNRDRFWPIWLWIGFVFSLPTNAKNLHKSLLLLILRQFATPANWLCFLFFTSEGTEVQRSKGTKWIVHFSADFGLSGKKSLFSGDWWFDFHCIVWSLRSVIRSLNSDVWRLLSDVCCVLYPGVLWPSSKILNQPQISRINTDERVFLGPQRAQR